LAASDVIVTLAELINTLKQRTGRVTILVHDQQGIDYAAGAVAATGQAVSIHMSPDDVPAGHAMVTGTER
jgi:hypothetical protein